jgi:ABC-type transporter Mla MlaB component
MRDFQRKKGKSRDFREGELFRCEGNTIRFLGELRMHDVSTIWCVLQNKSNVFEGDIEIGLQNVNAIDSGVLALFVEFKNELGRRGKLVNFIGETPKVRATIDQYIGYSELTKTTPRTPLGFVTQLGRSTFEVYCDSRTLIEYLGVMVRTAFLVLKRPTSGHWQELPLLCIRAGIQALPIVV